MIQSEILKEKDRIQAKLSEESASIHEYLVRSHLAAKEIAESYGFRLQYAEMPNKSGKLGTDSCRFDLIQRDKR